MMFFKRVEAALKLWQWRHPLTDQNLTRRPRRRQLTGRLVLPEGLLTRLPVTPRQNRFDLLDCAGYTGEYPAALRGDHHVVLNAYTTYRTKLSKLVLDKKLRLGRVFECGPDQIVYEVEARLDCEDHALSK